MHKKNTWLLKFKKLQWQMKQNKLKKTVNFANAIFIKFTSHFCRLLIEVFFLLSLLLSTFLLRKEV